MLRSLENIILYFVCRRILKRVALALNINLILEPEESLWIPFILQELKINLDHPKLSGEKTVQTAIAELAAIMGENVKLRRGFAMSAPSQGIISAYLHTSPQPGILFLKFEVPLA